MLPRVSFVKSIVVSYGRKELGHRFLEPSIGEGENLPLKVVGGGSRSHNYETTYVRQFQANLQT